VGEPNQAIKQKGEKMVVAADLESWIRGKYKAAADVGGVLY